MNSTDTVELSTGSPRVRVDDKPLSTDSMVTVRLSEVQEASDSSLDQEPDPEPEQGYGKEHEEEHVEEHVEEHEEEPEEEREELHDAASEEEREGEREESHDAESEPDTTTTSRPYSAASHISTAPSSGSNAENMPATSVDWDELEKTEEQEAKDEGTDEVGKLSMLAYW